MKKEIKKVIQSDLTFDIIVNLLGIIIILIVIIPLIFVLAASFSDPDWLLRERYCFYQKDLQQKRIQWFLRIRIYGEDSGIRVFIQLLEPSLALY